MVIYEILYLFIENVVRTYDLEFISSNDNIRYKSKFKQHPKCYYTVR